MKRSRYSDERIAHALPQVECGTAVADVCRQPGISEATFYVWKKKYANLGSTELRETPPSVPEGPLSHVSTGTKIDRQFRGITTTTGLNSSAILRYSTRPTHRAAHSR